jgi:hypothetical protein
LYKSIHGVLLELGVVGTSNISQDVTSFLYESFSFGCGYAAL